MITYEEICKGTVKILEKNLTEERAKELKKEADEFNRTSANGVLRGVFNDFVEKPVIPAD